MYQLEFALFAAMVDAAKCHYQKLMRRVGDRDLWTRQDLWTPEEDATIRRAVVSHERQAPSKMSGFTTCAGVS